MLAYAMATPSEIGQSIRRARKARGWKQEHLAQRVGVSKNRISVWENGRFVWIDDNNRVQLAQVLELKESDLEATPTPPPGQSASELAAIVASYEAREAQTAEQQRLLEALQKELLRVQQALELAGIALPRDVARPGGT